MVNTLLPLQEGRIEVLGYDVARAPMAVRRRLGYVPQQLSIEAALTGRENVTLVRAAVRRAALASGASGSPTRST